MCVTFPLVLLSDEVLNTLDKKNRRAVGWLNPMRDKNRKLKARTGGERRDDTCDHGLSSSWKVKVWWKKNKEKKNNNQIPTDYRVYVLKRLMSALSRKTEAAAIQQCGVYIFRWRIMAGIARINHVRSIRSSQFALLIIFFVSQWCVKSWSTFQTKYKLGRPRRSKQTNIAVPRSVFRVRTWNFDTQFRTGSPRHYLASLKTKWKSVDFSSISWPWKTFSTPYVGSFFFFLSPPSTVLVSLVQITCRISGPNFKNWEVHGQVSTGVPLHKNLHIIQGFLHIFRTAITYEMESISPYSSSQDAHAQKK